jgi:Uma2 family endonuclease
MGHDKRDEVWAGVLHMVPPPTLARSDVARELLLILVRIARRNGMDAFVETGLFDPTEGLRDYRVPDLIVASRDHTSQRGVEGRAAVVVEVLSPGDESREKLPFYAKVGVIEVWLVEPKTRAIEIFASRDGELVAIEPRDGIVHSVALGIELSTVNGRLRIGDEEL